MKYMQAARYSCPLGCCCLPKYAMPPLYIYNVTSCAMHEALYVALYLIIYTVWSHVDVTVCYRVKTLAC